MPSRPRARTRLAGRAFRSWRPLHRQRPRARHAPGLAPASGGGHLEVQALSGEAGKPIAGVEATLLRASWNPERIDRVASGTTDAKGLALSRFPAERAGRSLSLREQGRRPGARHEHRHALGREAAGRDGGLAPLHGPQHLPASPEDLLEGAGLSRATRTRAASRSTAGAPVTVTLLDQNNQKVDSKTATTNDFGSAAGEFFIPAGRALGTWRLSSSLGASARAVQVEEYKRPTFEVTWKDPSEPLRLNRPARLAGEARYYFGLPVASGTARWRVTRTPAVLLVVILVGQAGPGRARRRRSRPAPRR